MKFNKLIMVSGLVAAFAIPASVDAQTSRGDDQANPTINRVTVEQVNETMSGGRGVANPGITRVDETAFQAGSGLITFSEFPTATVNPSYDPADYGGLAGDPGVDFSGFFSGQALGDAATCPPGAALSGCVIGAPSAPLTLDATSPQTFITTDGANPTSPVLSGSPTFNGPIAILFDIDIAGVGLDGGFFDNPGGTAITAFARDGSVLGSVLNEGTGIEFLGLVTDDGSDAIAGLLFSLVGAESAGFAIDNVRFGTSGQVGPPPGPALAVDTLGGPALAILIAMLLLAGLVILRRSA